MRHDLPLRGGARESPRAGPRPRARRVRFRCASPGTSAVRLLRAAVQLAGGVSGPPTDRAPSIARGGDVSRESGRRSRSGTATGGAESSKPPDSPPPGAAPRMVGRTTGGRPRPASRRPRGATIPYADSPYRDRPPLYTPALVVDGILRHGPHVLLIRRRRPPWKDLWALPGGFVEIGESCEEAVVREFHEETGVRTRVDRLVGVYSDPLRDPRAHVVSVVFRLRGTRGIPRGGSDAVEARWWPVDRLPPLAADHARMLADEAAPTASRNRPRPRNT